MVERLFCKVPITGSCYIRLCSLLFLALMAISARGQDTLWTRLVGTSGGDGGYSVSLESSSGALYVAGRASASLDGETYVGSSDIFLMKFFGNGTRIWTRMAGTTLTDIANGVAVDSNSSAVYVTGYTQATLHGQTFVGNNDFFLIKYASNGTRVWTRMVGTTGDDRGLSVSVDASSGVVYVAGYASGTLHGQTSAGNFDILMMKYSSNGTRIWTKLVGSTSNDIANGVFFDDFSGCVYVTGYCSGSLHGETYVSGSDIFLMKYDSNGTRLWTRMSGTSGGDIGYSVSLDHTGDFLYLSGQAAASLHGESYEGGNDILLMKYASNGTRVWTKMVGTSGSDIAYEVAVDSNTGAVYVVGEASGNLHGQTNVGQSDILVMEFSSNGTRVWTRMVGTTTQDLARSASVDASTGAIYVAAQVSGAINGETFQGGSSDMALLRYTSTPLPLPTGQPTGQPSVQPSGQPTTQPSHQPSVVPSGQPSNQPSKQPTCQPTQQPSRRPSGQPTVQPSGQPSSQPTETGGNTICQYRTFREVVSGVEFTRYRCFKSRNNIG